MAQLYSIKCISSPELVLDKIAESTSLPDRSPVASDVEAVTREAFGGTMHREMKTTGMPSLEIKVKVALLGCDPPDIATRKVIVSAQDYEDFPLAHRIILLRLLKQRSHIFG
ncbi:hypothetical protein [Arthrobacter sp. BPSS-3]|uniref:hypothetical protein n=1 Tax=Arthrobacter sp. BPSS-3 TaxID=3366580 RepID=UPI0037DCEFD0